MSRINNRRKRGMTLAETLIAMVLLGLFGALAVGLVGPIASAPHQAQAKISTVQTGAQIMYRLQRDLRMSDALGVYACTSSPLTSCSSPTGVLTAATRFAIATPLDASGQLQVDPSTNSVAWTGVNVYCLLPNPSGGNDLGFSYQPISGMGSGLAGIQALPFATVASAVAMACTPSNVTIVATNIQSMQISANVANKAVGIRFVARTTIGGRTNETSYASESYARN